MLQRAPRIHLAIATALLVLVGCTPTTPAASGAGSGSPAPSVAPSIPASQAASIAASAAASTDPLCAAVAQLRTALATLKGLPASADATTLRQAAHDVGQAGATLIVLKAGAKDLTKLNHEALLVLGTIDAGMTPNSVDLTEFETTAQSVVDELASCP